jgi:hypothetical protein
LAVANVGQIPADRRGRTSTTTLVEDAMTLEDPTDRPDGRDGPAEIGPLEQGGMDRVGAVLAEDARLAQITPDIQDPRLQPSVRSGGAVRGVWSIAPVDPIEAPISRPGNPPLNGSEADAERTRGRPLRRAAAHRFDDRPPLPFGPTVATGFWPSDPSTPFWAGA